MAASLYDSYSCSSDDADYKGEHLEDLSYSHLETIPESALQRTVTIHSLRLDNNSITKLPSSLGLFKKLTILNISSNNTKSICDEICQLSRLKIFIAKNNQLSPSSIPKDFGLLRSLETINVSGNYLDIFPPQFCELEKLQILQYGSNQLKELPSSIKQLKRLTSLYLGGNELTEVPAELGDLTELAHLVLSDNLLQSLPPTLKRLHNLRSLSLHSNRLSTLPTEIVGLDLVELSLRKNPLVNRFVHDLVYNPPSLLELAGRCIKIEGVKYTSHDLPRGLIAYLDSSHQCVNPQCKGVYFSSRVEQVKFVDFCGKYRLPLLQYLCSPNCTTDSPSVDKNNDTTLENNDFGSIERMRRVLLG